MNSEQRERLRRVGRDQFIREEMTRLGFWPPDEETAQKAAAAEKELKVLYEELANARDELSKTDKEIGELSDIPKLLGEIRRKRIERVRGERARRKVEREKERAEKREEDRVWRRKSLPFLGRGVSGGLSGQDDDVRNRAAQERHGVPALSDASDVAAAIGIEERELAWLTYHRQAASVDHYSRFTIPKRRGGVRVISSPKTRLRVAQNWVLNSILAHQPVHEAAMAFRPGRSVADNAARHQGRAVIVKCDLKDFFPSIGLRRVKGLFESLGYNERVATILGLLCTETPRVAVTFDGEKRFVALGGRCLPQGACPSPAITNLLCRSLDARLTGAAEKYGFTYTRYADDLVFSHASGDAEVGDMLSLIRTVVAEEGYTVNEEKTRVLRPKHRQVVTGLVVNDGGPSAARISRQDIRKFRAFLHQCDRYGHEEMSKRIGQDALAYASGYLAFVHMVNPEQAERVARPHPWLSRWQRPSNG